MIGIGSRRSALEIARMTRSNIAQRLSRWLVVAGVLGLVALVFAPWRQSAVGTGEVIAYSPNERALTVQAPIDGRVTAWHFNEGDMVSSGDVIVELADNDPEVLAGYVRQRDAVAAQVEAATRSLEAQKRQLVSLRRVKKLTLASAGAELSKALKEIEVAEMKLAAARASRKAAAIHFERVRSLRDEGLESQRQLELMRRDSRKADAAVASAQSVLMAAKANALAKRAERESKGAGLDAKLASTEDKIEQMRGKREKGQETLAKVERALARQRSLEVQAPRDGMLLRVVARERSAYVKQGEKLAVVVPRTDTRAVALRVPGNDAPLVVAGERVQLQFEGWPAIQFGGWPQAAAGTFSGEVAFVDAEADEGGRFRVVVLPTEDSQWPSQDVLRQGNAVNGWILLREVRLGYELWRQLNGFPPDLPPKAAEASGVAKAE